MYLIRADGNSTIGAGHLMRCLTVADALGDKDKVRFVCADEESAALARRRGYEACCLGSDYRNPEEELPVLERRLKRNIPAVWLVDSYFVTDGYLEALGQYGKVVLLDDMGQRAFPVDGVINYNVFAEEETYRILYAGRDTKRYIGGRYVPVRPEFGKGGKENRQAKHLLITTGGSDKDNLAGAILSALEKSAGQNSFHYHVVVGAYSPYFQEWKERARVQNNITVHHDVQDMAGLMAACDIAVTAGGTTVYELAALGIPLVCFSYAENQEKLTEYMGRENIAGFAGAYHREGAAVFDRIAGLCMELAESRTLRETYSQRERQMTDGAGAARIAAVLKEFAGD